MNVRTIKASLDRLEDAILNSEYYKEYKEKLSKDAFKRRKFENAQRIVSIQLKFLQDSVWDIVKAGGDKSERQNILTLIDNIKRLDAEEDFKQILLLIKKIRGMLPEPQKQDVSFNVPNSLPLEIRDEIVADVQELQKCFEACCFRSAVIICGRILEACLHRKYYDATGKDILEKSPGIGLGKLIAKLMEHKVNLDPGLTQQVHLVNQVRIFSVHKKQNVFYPSKAQAQAMVLYTLDTVGRLF